MKKESSAASTAEMLEFAFCMWYLAILSMSRAMSSLFLKTNLCFLYASDKDGETNILTPRIYGPTKVLCVETEIGVQASSLPISAIS